MASITFNCPNCKALCAFKDIYKGRRARCLQCSQLFIIPDNEKQAAQVIEQPKENAEPLPGFYEAVFKVSFPAIFNKQSLATLLFILITTIVKFYTADLDFSFSIGLFTIFIPLGTVVSILVWGGILYCYSEIIYSTAFDVESLPEITFGGGFGYLFTILKTLYSFFIALIVVFLPAVVAKIILTLLGINSQWLVLPFAAIGIFLFPMAAMIVSISKDMVMLLRFDYFFMPVKKAFRNYMFVVIMFALLCQLQFMTRNYGDLSKATNLIVLANLVATLAVQILAVFEMRIIGLFYRHFACYFKW